MFDDFRICLAESTPYLLVLRDCHILAVLRHNIKARVYCPPKAACSGYTLGYYWACPGFSFSQSDKWERGRRCICTAFASDWGWRERLKVKDYVICEQLLIIIVWMCCVRRQRSTTAWILVLYSAGWRGHTLSYCHTYTIHLYTAPRALDTMDTCTYLVLLHPLSL